MSNPCPGRMPPQSLRAHHRGPTACAGHRPDAPTGHGRREAPVDTVREGRAQYVPGGATRGWQCRSCPSLLRPALSLASARASGAYSVRGRACGCPSQEGHGTGDGTAVGSISRTSGLAIEIVPGCRDLARRMRDRGVQWSDWPCWPEPRPKAHRPPTRPAREVRSLGERAFRLAGPVRAGRQCPTAAIPEGASCAYLPAASGPLSALGSR